MVGGWLLVWVRLALPNTQVGKPGWFELINGGWVSGWMGGGWVHVTVSDVQGGLDGCCGRMGRRLGLQGSEMRTGFRDEDRVLR